jgi:dephospho-CoA kinase
MIIIGITGTLGAGKGTIVDYLIQEEDFEHYSVRGFLLEEMKKMGMPENRDSMTRLANKLRAAFGPSYITDQS